MFVSIKQTNESNLKKKKKKDAIQLYRQRIVLLLMTTESYKVTFVEAISF